MEQLAPESRLTFSTEVMKIIDSVPLGVIFVDQNGRVRYVNQEANRIWGGRMPQPQSAREFGQFTGWWADNGMRVSADAWPIVEALAGRSTSGRVVDILNGSGGKISISISAAPLQDLDGNIMGAISLFNDVTEARERERFASVSRRIKDLVSSTIRPDDVLPQVLREVNDAVEGTQSVIYSARDDEWFAQERYGQDISTQPGLIGIQAAIARESADTGIVVCSFNTAEDADDTHRAMAAYDIGAFISQAIVTGGRIAGNLMVHFTKAQECTIPQLEFVRDAAFSIGRALAISDQYHSQEEIANVLQTALLDVPDDLPGVDYRASYTSAAEKAEVGGDFYDLMPLPGGRIGFVLGDVSGKGLDAAKMMMATKNAIRAYMFRGDSPARVVAETNRLLEATTAADKFVTLFCGALDTATGLFEYCSAGHPSGLIRRESGHLTTLPNTSTFVGAFGDAQFKEAEAGIAEGDYLFLYSDGAIEASGRQGQFGVERLSDLVMSSTFDTAVSRVAAEVTSFSGGRLKDDMALLAFRLDPQR